MIRCLIVDDAPLVRKGIRHLLEDHQDVEIVGEAADGPGAVAAVAELKPDVLFLDVQIPGFDGFEVLERISPVCPNGIIFVSAYHQYALKAFEANALSYLLKPIAPERFRQALDRARQVLASTSSLENPRARHLNSPALADDAPLPDSFRMPPLLRFVVKEGDRYLMLKIADVDWISSAAEYVEIHVRKKAHLVRVAISDVEQRLDPKQFARIHRSTIVNLDRVSEIRVRSHGDCDVSLLDGTTLRLTRNYRDRIFS